VIPLEEARQYVLDRCPPVEPRPVALDNALGAVLSEPVVSGEAVPPFANTAMDGFAVRAADVAEAPCTLDIVGTVAAGDAPGVVVGPGQAARIMTGAVIPEGADAVVMIERTQVTGSSVTVEVAVPVGNHIRPPGDDIRAGETVFPAGTVVGPGHLGVLASIGAYEVMGRPPQRVGVVSTGDELVDGPGPLEPGQIRDSNRRTLLALVGRMGAVPVDLGVAPDDEAAIEAVIRRGVADCDAVLTSGGVSMGDYDYVKAVLDRIGEMRWMQIAIRPAKPLAFGTVDGVPVFGLPGNPVSSMVSFELFARPGLLNRQGHPEPVRPAVPAVADETLSRTPDGKTHLVRVVATMGGDGRYHVSSAGGQGSHILSAMARADALALVPDGDGIEAGGEVGVLLLSC
jgi:molybdenum cofactor synthesis domain-containing protein